MRTRSHSLLLAALIALSPACSSDPDATPSPTPTPPPPEVAFAEVTEDGLLRVPTAALGRELLFTCTYAIGTSIETSNPLRTRRVYFEQAEGGAVAMKELQDGAAGPSAEDRALATFAAEADGDALRFDWSEGMRRAYLEFSVYEWWAPRDEMILDLAGGAVIDIGFRGDTLAIEHDATAEVPQAGAVPVTLRHGLSERRDNEGFEPRPNSAVGGSYVNAPIPAAGGEAAMFAHRHDARSPIVFHVNAAGAERRAEIELAVAYWNGIFSSVGQPRAIELADLAPEIHPLDPGQHVIAFIPDPTAGAGRAINTTDPLTGQILKSTVQVTSAFDLQGEDVATTAWMQASIDAGGAPAQLPAEALARAISDYYVNAFTHELGHALGFRHNFAGNLAGNVEPEASMQAFVDYLGGDLAEGVAPSSSVMEYLETSLATLVGAHIRLGRAPLVYDVQAVEAMYGAGREGFELFCEQELAELYVDCAEFDQGRDTLRGAYWQWERQLDDTAFRLARSVVGGTPLDAPELDPALIAMVLADPLSRLARHLDADAEYLAIRAAYPESPSAAELAQYRGEVLAYQQAGYAALTGPRAAYVQDLVGGALDAARVGELSGEVRAKMEGYLAAVGGSVDAAAADAYFAALATALGDQVAPLNALTYACVSCP